MPSPPHERVQRDAFLHTGLDEVAAEGMPVQLPLRQVDAHGGEQQLQPFERLVLAGDDRWKSPAQVIIMLVMIARWAGNLLLNIGPRADGTVPERSAEILREVGA